MRRRPLVLASAAALALAAPAAAALASVTSTAAVAGSYTVYGITSDNHLVSFSSANPGKIRTNVAIRVAPPGGPLGALPGSVQAIDFSARSGDLFAVVTDAGEGKSYLYTINRVTGVAVTETAPRTEFTPTIGGSTAGLDMNEFVDKLRVVTSTQNFRISPHTGVAMSPDTAPSVSSIGNVAYDNARPEADSATLYGIDTAGDALVKLPSPNGGLVDPPIGALGFDAASGPVGFDIVGDDNQAYALLRTAGETAIKLYRVDLATGKASGAKTVGGGLDVIDIAVDPEVTPGQNQVLLLDAPSTRPRAALASDGLTVRYSCAEACTTTLTLKAGSTKLGSATVSRTGRGKGTTTLTLSSAGKTALGNLFTPKSTLSVSVTLSGSATDADGGATATDSVPVKITR